MHKEFNAAEIERKWQQVWDTARLYDVNLSQTDTPAEYVLVEWPYPSGNLHIGHWYAFAVPDIYVRFRRMQGVNVLYPMGFDAFGLPAENAAIKHNVNPRTWTESNIKKMETQLRSMGSAFSWNTTTSSTDPDYYRWTQWMFAKFFTEGLAYRGTGVVNWCPGCNTVIANEQVLANGTCERCKHEIEKKKMPQWMIKITDYADRLVDDLDDLNWPEHIKEAQRQWIGRSSGAEIDFTLSTGDSVTVFTTRPDTLHGATYMVLAPEHPLVAQNAAYIKNNDEVAAYLAESQKKDEQDRLDGTKEKTGVLLDGITAANPATGEDIPVYISDYVLMGYGTGAIMAVPAHDERDHAFAQKFGLPIRQVVARHFDLGTKPGVETLERGDVVDLFIEHPTDGTFLLQREKEQGGPDHVHFVGGGTEGELHDIAIGRELLEETGFSDYEVVAGPVDIQTCLAYRHTKDKNQKTKSHFYHLKLRSLEQVPSEIEEGKHTIEWVHRDAVAAAITWSGHDTAWDTFLHGQRYVGQGTLCNSGEFDGLDSEEAKAAIVQKVGGRMTKTYRLRDWSIGRQRYWGVPIPIVYDPDGAPHPVPAEHLPWTLPEDVDFTPTGEPPLAKSKELHERTERLFGPGWTPETETMDTFVDSSWYFLRFLDPANNNEVVGRAVQQDWMPVDIYFGGAEHTTMHLLYSRFWQKALYDLGIATESEPYRQRINRGLIMGPDGEKMSKSKGNVIDPDEEVARVGADTVKMYLAFMGPYEGNNYPWDPGGVVGIHRFLERVYGLPVPAADATGSEAATKQLHRTAAKLAQDIPQYKFNTAISALMVCVNTLEKEAFTLADYHYFLRLLAPFAPHLTEELWYISGETESIHNTHFPEAEVAWLVDDTVTIGVQVDGKVRGDITIAPEADEATALEAVYANENLAERIKRDQIARIIYKPGKIMSIMHNK